MDADTALAIGLADSVTRSTDTLANTVQQFIEPICRQVSQVARAYKAIAVAVRQGESRERLAALETRMFAETWVHEDHWAAADKILQKGGPS